MNYLQYKLLNETEEAPFFVKITIEDFVSGLLNNNIIQFKDNLILLASVLPDNDPIPSIADDNKTVSITFTSIPENFKSVVTEADETDFGADTEVDTDFGADTEVDTAEDETQDTLEDTDFVTNIKQLDLNEIKPYIFKIEIDSEMVSDLENDMEKVTALFGIKPNSITKEELITKIKSIISEKLPNFNIKYI